MEDALLLAHMRCDANCSAANSVAHAINRFWSGLGLDARRTLTSEKKHVVLQSLRKKHLHTRNCPCCQHSKVFFDGGARTYERFCTAWENQPDDAGLIDIHSPAILGVDENTEADKSKLNKKKKGAKSESKPRPRGAKRTFLDELEERENRIREAEEREREREREIEAERNRNKPEEREEDVVYVDVPTIFGDALSVKAGVISLKSSEIARDDLWTFLLERYISKKTLCSENDCQAKNKQHYKKCEICSSYHVFELFLFHTFFDNVKRAQVDEIRRQHAEACAKLLLEEEHNKKANKKTTSKSKKRKERRSRKEACDCKCHDGGQAAPTASPVIDHLAQAVEADGSGESGNEVSEDEVRTDEGQNSDGDLDTFVSEEEEEEEEDEEEVEAGDVSTEEEEEQAQESEEEPEVRVEPQQQIRHEVDDGRGWTKQTNRKKPKKAAKPEVAVLPAKTCPPGLSLAVPTRSIPTPNRVTTPPSTAPALLTNSAPSLKRHTPFAEIAKEKHRKQGDGNHLCLNQLHDHNHSKHALPNKPLDAQPKQSASPLAAPASATPAAAAPALPKKPQTSASTAKPAPIVPGPPPPHFPYWSRHHHNVIPKNWVWKAKKEEQSAAEAKAQAQAKGLEEERKRQERQEKIRSAAAVLKEAIREAGDASDVSFMKETLKELNDQANAKFCCDCAFDKPEDADKQRQQTDSGPACSVPDCRDVDCCYSHFDGPSLFSIDPVMFPFSHNYTSSLVSSPSSWPSSPTLDYSYQFSSYAAGEPCADSLHHGHHQPWLLHSYT
ncbi:uncharacterized protein ACA1_148020 [Acanthamoeba castellanii str. Neff]|uniref:Stress response protein NST1 n=1 Tax=Acanthamoeba castellanii (strain ATCC 30010 / Neff) TaxID=1257118 RepID=L8GKL4_ACACF|nr:uncharacterized protein ACA1_148020 [Acanthamoeba castellanii str. Neff]ELR13273.1 hypothetical protein ACA1_148020 [Acanthamoeba castellanii str. Neff]